MAHKIDWLVDFFLFDLFLVFHVIIGFLNLILVRFELQFQDEVLNHWGIFRIPIGFSKSLMNFMNFGDVECILLCIIFFSLPCHYRPFELFWMFYCFRTINAHHACLLNFSRLLLLLNGFVNGWPYNNN